MICPRCDEQGLIYKAKVVDLAIVIQLCDECDACWLENQVVSLDNFKGLTEFLEEHNLTYEKSEIINLACIDGMQERKRKYFNISETHQLLSLIDEAWLKKDKPLSYDPGAYVINMHRIVGVEGESGIKIIVKPGTAEIKTAYPVRLE